MWISFSDIAQAKRIPYLGTLFELTPPSRGIKAADDLATHHIRSGRLVRFPVPYNNDPGPEFRRSYDVGAIWQYIGMQGARLKPVSFIEDCVGTSRLELPYRMLSGQARSPRVDRHGGISLNSMRAWTARSNATNAKPIQKKGLNP